MSHKKILGNFRMRLRMKQKIYLTICDEKLNFKSEILKNKQGEIHLKEEFKYSE